MIITEVRNKNRKIEKLKTFLWVAIKHYNITLIHF